MNYGYLYIAIGDLFLKEAELSARSLRRFTKYPVCLVTDNPVFHSMHFSQIIRVENIGRSFEVKIAGMQLSPYDKTVFLDCDTFVCNPIDEIFDLLDKFDMAMTVYQGGISKSFWDKYKPDYKLSLVNSLYEYHTGVIGFKKNKTVTDFIDKWLSIHRDLNIYADMPTFREAFLKYPLMVATLPYEYNVQGIKSMTVLHGPVRVIHERLGERWNNLRSHYASFSRMDKFAKRINKKECKRLLIPYVGIIPYYFSPFYIKQKIKKMFGVKVKRKRESI
jgi:hypothetical protein